MENIYLYPSIAVGFAQILDAIYLWQRNGNITRAAAWFGFLEYVWAGVSIVVILNLNTFGQIPVWLPVSFVIYVVLGWIYGRVFKESFKKGDLYVLPRWAIATGGFFGASFCVASWIVA